MVKIDLKGVAKVQAKGRVYYYAWRGGPRLCGDLGSPEFIASFNQAIENRKMPDSRRFYSLVVLYKSSSEISSWPHRLSATGPLGSIASLSTSVTLVLLNLIAQKKSGPSSASGAASGPIDPAPPTTECKFFLASFPMLLSSAKLP
jgi:hypothetical protein